MAGRLLQLKQGTKGLDNSCLSFAALFALRALPLQGSLDDSNKQGTEPGVIVGENGADSSFPEAQKRAPGIPGGGGWQQTSVPGLTASLFR